MAAAQIEERVHQQADRTYHRSHRSPWATKSGSQSSVITNCVWQHSVKLQTGPPYHGGTQKTSSTAERKASPLKFHIMEYHDGSSRGQTRSLTGIKILPGLGDWGQKHLKDSSEDYRATSNGNSTWFGWRQPASGKLPAACPRKVQEKGESRRAEKKKKCLRSSTHKGNERAMMEGAS